MLRILIVDDSKIMRKIIIKTLRIAEFPIESILEASNGLEAWNIIQKKKVDLVLLDINMPVMNGIEFIEKVTGSKLKDKLKIVVITSDSNERTIDYAKNKGMVAYIKKPFQPEDIRDTIEELMGEISNG